MTRDEAITEITLRLVEYYPTERVFCFGSHSQYESSPYSDLDFCVLVPGDASVEIFQDGGIYSLLRGIGYPKDTVPLHRSDFDARAMRVGLQMLAQPLKTLKQSQTAPRLLESINGLISSNKYLAQPKESAPLWPKRRKLTIPKRSSKRKP